ncbi:uncharacterized protein LOC114319199 [Camellia sinensis]|uniref:uncharacterized protein LOC114319199 n=1 Tax=Camellia sinensis TaxID=4442 RepID=UPI001036B692|nr:uncharacterized protein LOC114319199 [Camellia sinensis]
MVVIDEGRTGMISEESGTVDSGSEEFESLAEGVYNPSDYITSIGQVRPNVELPVRAEICVIRGDELDQRIDDWQPEQGLLETRASAVAGRAMNQNTSPESAGAKNVTRDLGILNTRNVEQQVALTQLEWKGIEDSEKARKGKAPVGIERAGCTRTEHTASIGTQEEKGIVEPKSEESRNSTEEAYNLSDYILLVGQVRLIVELPERAELCMIRGDRFEQWTDNLTAMEEDLANLQFFNDQDPGDATVDWIKKGLNSTFLTLIPKIPNPSSLSDYRPISLLGCIYKVLAMVLSSRLKSVLPNLIDETQSAFVKGRQILDGILIANEVVDLWKRNSSGGLLLKLDFQKAFDSVNWNFLFHILQNFGFGEKWISWVKECVSSPHISVLVNGSPSQEFPPQRGLRQGDPLSPFLFNLVVEGLNFLIQRAKNLNLIKGVDIGGSGLNLSHLQFADDTLMFCNPDWDEIINLKRILSCFELISGLKINYQKSVICGVGVNRDFTSQVAEFFNCRVSSLPINYLGMPLGANPKRLSTWEPIINKVKKRLASWKKRYLSLGGRITLIKSVLSSLPIYYMSLFKIPTQVANLIDKYQRSFLWGDSDAKRKLHLLNWEACSVSKHFGGLGFRKTKEGNDTLLCKWWWRFATEKSSLWRKVLCAKNNVNEDCWLPNGSSFRFSSAVWKSISTMERYGSRAIALFLENIQFKLGDGKRIKFWLDTWVSCTPLANLYPRLFSLATSKDSFVHQYLYQAADNQTHWNISYRRTLRAWEDELHLELISRLPKPLSINNNCVDHLLWTPFPSGSFTVKSLYEIFENSLRLTPFLIMKM